MNRLSTRLFAREGKQNLTETVRFAAKFSNDFGIDKIIVFTSEGDGVLALQRRLKHEQKLYAATFPHQMLAHDPEKGPFYIGLPSTSRRKELTERGIVIVQGSMPFGTLGDAEAPWFTGLSAALGLFGGGFHLCVQAVLMVCDAGYVDATERCLVMTADTALVIRAGHSHSFFRKTSTLAVEHIICKPQYYQISRGAQEDRIAEAFANQEALGSSDEPTQLTIDQIDS